MTKAQKEFVALARDAFPSAKVKSERDDETEGFVIVSILDDGMTQYAYVTPEGNIEGNWF